MPVIPRESHSQRYERWVYLTLLRSMANPGQWENFPKTDMHSPTGFLSAFQMGCRCLLDAEPMIWCELGNSPLISALSDLRLRWTSDPSEADYLLLNLDPSRIMNCIHSLKVGTPLYPNASATLLIGVPNRNGSFQKANLSGPGIRGERIASLPAIDGNFWSARNTACRYPLGWDVILFSNEAVMSVPRSTNINLAQPETESAPESH
jgi:alpha-D-ribose 1-methylphosphonate 5-triphosphate synthase subunit PhnH